MEIGRDGFYQITHISNLKSILKRGLYSHDQVRKRKISSSVVYDKGIVERRRYIPTDKRKSLHEYINLYFNPRNSMMYRVKAIEERDVIVIQLNSGILGRKGVFLADGNAAANATNFHLVDKETLAQLRHQVDRESWNDADEIVKKENVSKMMAECLVPVHIPPEMIEVVHVVDRRSAVKAMRLLSGTGIRLIVNPHMFFSSGKEWEFVRNIPRPAPVSRPRSIPQHGVKVAVQRSETHAKPESVSPANAPAAPANTPVAAFMIASVGVPASAPTPTRRKTQQTRKSEVRVPAHVSAVSSRAGRKSGMSRLWDWLAFLLMICFVLALYEAIRRLLV